MSRFCKRIIMISIPFISTLISFPSLSHSTEEFMRGVYHTPFSVHSDKYCPEIDWDYLDSLGITHVLTSVIEETTCVNTVLEDIGDRDIKVYADSWLIGDDDCYTNNGCESLTWYATSGYSRLDSPTEMNPPEDPCEDDPFYNITHGEGEPEFDDLVQRDVWHVVPGVDDADTILKAIDGYDA